MMARTSTRPSIPALRSKAGYCSGGPDRNTGRSSTVDSVGTPSGPGGVLPDSDVPSRSSIQMTRTLSRNTPLNSGA